jgi:hypothetical protein
MTITPKNLLESGYKKYPDPFKRAEVTGCYQKAVRSADGEHYAANRSDLATAPEETLQKIQARHNSKGYGRCSDLEDRRSTLSSPFFKKFGKHGGNRLARRQGDTTQKAARNPKNLIEG